MGRRRHQRHARERDAPRAPGDVDDPLDALTLAAGADHGGAADDRADDPGARLDDHPAFDLGLLVDLAFEDHVGQFLARRRAADVGRLQELGDVAVLERFVDLSRL